MLLLMILSNLMIDEGVASYYSNIESGTITASGEIFDDTKLTCAMRTKQFGTYCLVIRADTFRFVVCKLTDRGPYISGRAIDLSKAAMQQLNGIDKGLVPVYILTIQKEQS